MKVVDTTVIQALRHEQTCSEGKRAHVDLEMYSLLRFRDDAETEKVIPNQFNGTTDDSFLGVCGTERIAVIAGTWQRNQAPASRPLACIPWGPPVQRLDSLS